MYTSFYSSVFYCIYTWVMSCVYTSITLIYAARNNANLCEKRCTVGDFVAIVSETSSA